MRFKQLELESMRLKRAVADLTLDKQILKEAAKRQLRETSEADPSSPVCRAR